MPIRTAITRVTGQGEQFVVDVCQWNPVSGEIMHQTVDEMRKLANDMLELSDIRMYEMNMRMLEAYGLEKHFEPEIWQKIIQLLDILAGRTDISTVLQRWEATKEENAALEAGRLKTAIANAEEQAHYEAVVARGECTCHRLTSIVQCPVHEIHVETGSLEQFNVLVEIKDGYAASCGCTVLNDGAVTLCEKHS